MDLLFSIYDILNVALYDVPQRITPFLIREYEYFKQFSSNEPGLEVRFVDQVIVPEGAVSLTEECSYKDGVAYFALYGAKLMVPIKNISSEKIRVEVERNISEWFILYVVEKILHLKVIEKGFCFLHAAGYVRQGQAVLYSSLQKGGKTQWVLNRLGGESDFLGDDLVLVSREGDVFAYPRGINVHIFHGSLYDEALMKSRPGNGFKHFIDTKFLRGVSSLFSMVPGLSSRLDNRVKSRSLLRLSIDDLVKGARIANKAKLQKVFALIPKDYKADRGSLSEKALIADFLAYNIGNERLGFIGRFIDPFLSLEDESIIALTRHVKQLLEKEKGMLRDIISHCETEILSKKNVAN